MNAQIKYFLPFLGLLLVACQHSVESNTSTLSVNYSLENAENDFWDQLSKNCNKIFIGQSTFPDDINDSFYGKELKAIVQSCTESEIRVPFSVGSDTSRTWIFTRSSEGIQLKHQHLHEDGSVDEVSNYGGMAASSDGTFIQAANNTELSMITLAFPADDYTKNLIPAAATNVWSISIISKPESQYSSLVYHLERHNKIRFEASLQIIN